ncbi:MAG: PTS sugar transporter subunit IIC, partial [Candidatus Scatosoma sp.]
MEEKNNGTAANGAEIAGTEQSTKKKSSAVTAYFKALPKRWFITAFSGMAQGLFVTLIAGTILAMFAGWLPEESYLGKTLTDISKIAKTLMGAGIGVGIAHALGKNKLLIFSAAAAGMVGAFAEKFFPGAASFTAITLGSPGNPIGAYVVTMLVVEIVS